MKKILVVDDDQTIMTLVQAVLKSHQYEVITAVNGVDALKKLKEDKPDLILLDVMMPEMDGFSFVQEVKNVEGMASVPIIVLTSQEAMEDIFKIEGVKEYVLKPFQTSDLLEKVEKHLS